MPHLSLHRLVLSCCLIAIAGVSMAATTTIDFPVPTITPHNQPVIGHAVVLECHTASGVKQFVPVADTHLWKGSNKAAGKGKGLALRDNQWCVGALRYDVSSLTGKTVTKAILHVPVQKAERPGNGHYAVCAITVPWTEAATWTHSGKVEWQGLKQGKHRTPVITKMDVDASHVGQVIALEGLNEHVNQWIKTPSSNHGLSLHYNGRGVQTGVPSRENISGRTTAVLNKTSYITLGWDTTTLQRVLMKKEHYRQMAIRLTLSPAKKDTPATGTLTLRSHDNNTVLWKKDLTLNNTQTLDLSDLPSPLDATTGHLYWDSGQDINVSLRGKKEQRPTAKLTLANIAKTNLFPRDNPIKPNTYCSVKDGHLYYDGKRLRLWGSLGYGSKARLRALGFNAYRLWGPNTQRFDTPGISKEYGKKGILPPTTKGDGSRLDQFDQAMAECKDLGLFVMATFLMRNWIPGAELSGSFVDNGGDFAQWQAAIKASPWKPTVLARYVSMVDDRFNAIHKRASSQILNRVNPYTGKRYAEEETIVIQEFANEHRTVKNLLDGDLNKLPPYFKSKFAAKWKAYLVERYRDDAGLKKAWGKLNTGESLQGNVALEPTLKTNKNYPEARGGDVIRFITHLHRDFFLEIKAHCRSHAPEGIGVNVVPFSYDTQYRPHTPWTYAASAGDTQTFGMYFWNWNSALSKPPAMYVMDSTTVENKPTVIYETNRGRPSPYRAEYPFMLASFAAWQDWDAIFFHYWGGPRGNAPDEQFMTLKLNNGNASHFWTAVHTAEDPAMCAAAAVAGQAFLSGTMPSAKNPAIYELGRDALFSYKKAFNGVRQTNAAFSRGSRLRFSPDKAGGVIKPADHQDSSPESAVIPHDDLKWDWPNERLILDTPTAKFYVGKTATYTFKDGLTLSGFNTAWASIGIVSTDGKPIVDSSAKLWVCAVGNAQNTDFNIDLTANMSGPINQIKARTDNGRLPLIVDDVHLTISFPTEVEGTLTSHDFARRVASTHPVTDGNAIRINDAMFLGTLELGKRGSAKQAIVDADTVDRSAKNASTAASISRKSYWMPFAKTNWDMSPREVKNVLGAKRDSFLEGEDIVMGPLNLFLKEAQQIRFRYAFGRMMRLEGQLITPPNWQDAEAQLTKQFGKPHRRKLGTQFEGSEAHWTITKPEGKYALELTDIQGIMRLTLSAPR